MLVMLANKNTRNACLLSIPSDHGARGAPSKDALARTPLWSTMMKAFLSRNGHQYPKQEDGDASGQIALCLQVLICPPPLQGHHLMVTLLLDQSKVIIQPMKDGDGKRTFELGLIFTISCHPWDSNAKQNPLNPPQQDTPIPCMPCKQTPRQPTPGPSGTRLLEDLFHEPSHHNEPPIPGPSQPSKPHKDALTSEPEPEVALMQSMEEPFARLATPTSVIIIDNAPVGSPPPFLPQRSLPTPSSPHSHDEACQEFTNLQPTLMIP
ncbi:hypothetical protein O181_029286 [Austropuccinia psidii MF-1]|uniref:Uncharacterized protein n=1 Tax=Austropuccinia psidii MF-1 TaxID=1389203 RepID=A0A9Q3CQS2_9BASI|nr:hypothetical protein [Austropuccinia psidii MF-1]